MKPPRPDPLPLDPEAVPPALKDRPTWVCWRYVWKRDREEWTKLPIDVTTGDAASSTDPETWGSFEAALQYHQRDDAQTDGVGYVVSDDDLLVGVDLDDCVDPETGETDPWAADVVDSVPTYWERSPSGTGLRGFGFGFLPDGKTRADVDGADGHIEVYETGRYLTVTGARLEESTVDVEQVNDAVHDLHAEYISDDDADDAGAGDSTPADAGTAGTNPTPDAGKTGSSDLSDAEIVETATDAANGEKFSRLWNGDTSGYASHSEADLALCNLLAFYTGGDRTQIDRLFRDSGLYREKWDEQRGSETYGDLTISEALKRRTEFYDPEQGRSTPSDRPDEPQPDGQTPALDSSSVKAYAGLGEDGDVSDLTDREKAAVVADLVRKHDDLHVRVRRDNRTLWGYDDDAGVWKPEGDRTLEHAARTALGSMNYGQNVSKELKAQARARREWEVESDTFGLSPGLIAVENGVVFLQAAAGGAGDAALRELEPEDYALTRLPVTYDPDATYAEWEDYVEEWAEDGMADALQEYVGYCLHTGSMPIHRALLLVGSGANGKGTFLSVVRALLGEANTTSIGLQTLANEKDAVADFYGSLANIDDDLSSRKLGSGLGMFKKLVAGDRVRGRRLYEDGFEYQATGKHLYAANQVPQVDVDDEDEAFWRRWLLVEFPNHYPKQQREPNLGDRLTEPETLSGVLNWAIDGWARLLEQGHFTNEEEYAHDKRRRWQKWGDSVDEFISECVENDPDADRLTTGEAYQRYKAWCEAQGEDAVSQRKLTSKLKAENVGYKDSLQVPKGDGKVTRGYDALGLSDDVPTVSTDASEDDDRDEGQQSII
jgi:putative DNA primase/helicase